MATRRERVILELQDDFTSGMARAAAATALLDKNLGSLSGSAVKSRRSVSDMNQPDALPALNRNSAATSHSINQLTGRLRLMVDAATVLGPALVPLGAAAVPALSGMATQLTLTAAAAGTAFLAFNGVGEGLKALNEYQLDPTAANLGKLEQAMGDLGPAGADFVHFLDSLGPRLKDLQMTAREGMLPGVEEGLTSLMNLLPQVDRIVGDVAGAMGQLAREAGAGLSGEGFTAFFDYMEAEARPILLEMGRTIGNFAEGLANMLVGFAPLSADFSGGLLEMSRSFSEWSKSLETNDSFQGFIDYVQKSGPKALDLLGSLVDAFVAIARAAAPIGDVVLPALTALVDTIAALANSEMGTMFFAAAAGLAAYSRAAGIAQAATSRLALTGTTGLGRLNEAAARLQTGMRLGAGAVGLLALSMTDLDDKAGLSNTAMGAMAGMMVGGPWGAAIGTGIGGVMDLAHANDDLEQAITRANQALRSMDTSALRRSRDELEGMLRETEQGFTLGSFFTDLTHIGDDANFGTAAMNKLSGAADEAEDKLREVQAALSGAGNIGNLLAGPLGLTADSFNRAAQSARDFRNSVADAFGMLDQRAALRAARAAVREFTAAMDEAPDKMREGGPAYDKVEEALDNIARSSLTAAEGMKGLGRVNFIDKMRGQFIQSAEAMGMTRREAGRLATELGLLDKSVAKPKIDVDNKGAKGKINEANFWLTDFGKKRPKAKLDADNSPARAKTNEANNWLTILGGRAVNPKVNVQSDAAAVAAQTTSALNSIQDEEVWITTRRRGTGLGAVGAADGMTVPGMRQPYGDKIIAHLAPGEEVISNRFGQADKHRELLKAINANRYADGGTAGRVSRPYVSSRTSTSTSTVERVVERMPGTVVLNAPGLGRIVATVADQRIASNQRYNNRLDDRD